MIKPVVIDENICEGCGTCYEQFACPAIARQPNRQALIINDLCNGNGSCIQVCPVQAIVRPGRDDPPKDIKWRFQNSTTEPEPGFCEPGGGK